MKQCELESLITFMILLPEPSKACALSCLLTQLNVSIVSVFLIASRGGYNLELIIVTIFNTIGSPHLILTPHSGQCSQLSNIPFLNQLIQHIFSYYLL